MSEQEPKSLIQRVNEHAYNMLIQRLARPIHETLRAQGEKIEIPRLLEPPQQQPPTNGGAKA